MASSEKSNAMRSFQLKRNFENIFHFFNVCAAVLLFSHSPLFPITLQTFSNFRTFLTPLFNNSFYAFLLLNAIILFLLALSNKTTNTDNVVYHQFLIRSASRLTITVPQEQEQPATVEFEESSSVSPVSEETVAAVNETTTTTCCTTLAKVSEEKKKCYRRVQSERRMVVAPRRELKRFNTNASGNRRLQTQRRLCCVEQLSKDEFNRTVEEFIAKHKRMQWEEQVESQKTGYFAITP